MDSDSSRASSPEAQNSAGKNKGRKLRLILICSGVVTFLVAAVVFISWIVCKPQKPRFRLDDVSVSSRSVGGFSGPSLMVTLSSKNPSGTDMNYGDLAVYLSVKDKKTETAYGTGMLLNPKEIATWTVMIPGTNGDIASSAQGEKGTIRVHLWVQWKMGLIYTPKFKYDVECPVIFKGNDLSSGSEKPMRMTIDSRCSVH